VQKTFLGVAKEKKGRVNGDETDGPKRKRAKKVKKF
jgi:hypothetical protein